jgi:Flp pilus assembly pilin Flp
MRTNWIARFLANEGGQAMVEYAIVTALIAVVAMAAVQALGVGVSGAFNNIVSSLTSV